jgi:hypothetical protein
LAIYTAEEYIYPLEEKYLPFAIDDDSTAPDRVWSANNISSHIMGLTNGISMKPGRVGGGTNAAIFGDSANSANGDYSLAEGQGTHANGNAQHV